IRIIAVSMLLLAGIVVIVVIIFNRGKTYELSVTVGVRDSESATLRPASDAHVLAVPSGSAGDVVLNEYASLARDNVKAAADVYAKMEDVNRKRNALMAEVDRINAERKLPYSGDSLDNFRAFDDRTRRL